MLQIELKNANDHIAYLTNLTGEKLKTFGMTLMKVEEDFIDLGDGNKIKVSCIVTHVFSLNHLINASILQPNLRLDLEYCLLDRIPHLTVSFQRRLK
jgi:hypothetical protein